MHISSEIKSKSELSNQEAHRESWLLIERGCDQRPTEGKKQGWRKNKKEGIDSIINDVSDYWVKKKPCRGRSEDPNSETKEDKWRTCFSTLKVKLKS